MFRLTDGNLGKHIKKTNTDLNIMWTITPLLVRQRKPAVWNDTDAALCWCCLVQCEQIKAEMTKITSLGCSNNDESLCEKGLLTSQVERQFSRLRTNIAEWTVVSLRWWQATREYPKELSWHHSSSLSSPQTSASTFLPPTEVFWQFLHRWMHQWWRWQGVQRTDRELYHMVQQQPPEAQHQ